MNVTYAPKKSAPNQMDYIEGTWQFGTYWAAFEGSALVGLGFSAESKRRFHKAFPHVELISSDKAFDLDTALKTQDLQIICYGTAFQHDVWRFLVAMKTGETCNYADIANDIGRPKATRAVGTAVGMNPVSVFIPCHRILPKSGGVGNYGGGPEIKEKLLEFEGIKVA